MRLMILDTLSNIGNDWDIYPTERYGFSCSPGVRGYIQCLIRTIILMPLRS